MQNRKSNEELLNSLYKNAHVALQSISDLLPETDDSVMKAELKEQYEGYERIIGEISGYMKQNDMTPKDISPMKKMMLRASVKMNAAKNDDRTHIAEMMIKGTIMGITDIYRELGEKEGKTEPEIEALANKLVGLEEGYEKRLKAYL